MVKCNQTLASLPRQFRLLKAVLSCFLRIEGKALVFFTSGQNRMNENSVNKVTAGAYHKIIINQNSVPTKNNIPSSALPEY